MCENLLKFVSLWFYPHLENLDEAQNASSLGFFPQVLHSIFGSIY